jgi:hypothetical protein
MRSKNALYSSPLTAASLPVNPKSSRDRREIRLDAQKQIERKLAARPVRPQSGPAELLRPVDQLPDPWLFDSEALLRELDRCREMVLLIPAPTQAIHFAVNNAITAIWNLREQLRYLLSLHRDGQRAFAKKAVPSLTSTPTSGNRQQPTPNSPQQPDRLNRRQHHSRPGQRINSA